MIELIEYFESKSLILKRKKFKKIVILFLEMKMFALKMILPLDFYFQIYLLKFKNES